ncbi:MAG: tRNA 2-selenouridine(34) synthase MnmH [Pseudomonadota bacterium]
MPQEFSTLDALLANGFDSIIDVRSPAEFAEDHIPGAVNLPALDDAQRAEIGTTFKQISPFDARKLGAGMVIRNVAGHIDGPLSGKDGAWRPILYCWRGGQRSGVFGTILSEIGWRAQTIKGGYQTYRRLVYRFLYEAPLPHQVVLLDGYTGTAKTALLERLAKRGAQILDLEALAHHRGSLLGGLQHAQPMQKGFETSLAAALHALDPTRPVIIEAESSKIGKITLPPSVWKAMQSGPRIVLEVPRPIRAAYLARAYEDILSDPTTLAARLEPLRRLRGHAIVDRWVKLSQDGALPELSAALITEHYDPAYDKSRRIAGNTTVANVKVESLNDEGLDIAADQVMIAADAIQVQLSAPAT